MYTYGQALCQEMGMSGKECVHVVKHANSTVSVLSEKNGTKGYLNESVRVSTYARQPNRALRGSDPH